MSAARFFSPATLQAGQAIDLPADAAHHARHALRLPDGAPIVLFDGQGGEYPATLRITPGQTLAETGPHDPVERELRGRIHLVQGIAAGDRMEWIVEKAVELGVAEFHPVAAERSVLRLAGARLEKRLARWHAIVRAASAQCGRNRLMRVHPPTSLKDCLAQADGMLLLCDPEGGESLATTLVRGDTRPLWLAVGPEGGWSPGELAAGARHTPHRVRFGPRVLRTETAGIALTAAAVALLGWQD